MLRSRLPALAALWALAASHPALGQAAPAASPPVIAPAPVAVTDLAAPDLFSAGGDTGLGADLWRGTSPGIFKTVLPMLAAKPLSPAARAWARRVLATGATAPGDAGRDPALAGRRVQALIALGWVKDARDILSKTSGLDRDPALAQAAVEAALLAGDADRACAVGDSLGKGRDEPYWLRLRAYCQLKRGDAGAAQLTFDLAQGQAKDAVYGRLMGARLLGSGDPGKASLRNGLDYALSRDLGLDLAAATPSPAVAAALNPEAPAAAGDAAGAVLPTLDDLVARAAAADPKGRPRAQAAALLVAALTEPDAAQRGVLAGFTAGEAKASPARLLLLDQAAAAKRPGEAALLALWISADAGAAGPASADRARIVRALRMAGLEADARAYALEGLAALR